jgi:hypothetical protein
MSEPLPALSSLTRLVIFMVCLSMAGSVLAGVHYFAIDLPDQQKSALQSPENAVFTKCKNCQLACSYSTEPFKCLDDCDLLC